MNERTTLFESDKNEVCVSCTFSTSCEDRVISKTVVRNLKVDVKSKLVQNFVLNILKLSFNVLDNMHDLPIYGNPVQMALQSLRGQCCRPENRLTILGKLFSDCDEKNWSLSGHSP